MMCCWHRTEQARCDDVLLAQNRLDVVMCCWHKTEQARCDDVLLAQNRLDAVMCCWQDCVADPSVTIRLCE